jgi:hypothetical protein
MNNATRGTVTPDMQARLAANRDGKLTGQQWKEMVTEPLATMLLLLVPGIILLRARVFYFVAGGGWLIGLLVLAVLVGMLLLRANRYARAPIHVGYFQADEQFRPFWMFWKAEAFKDDAGNKVRFFKRLAPAAVRRAGERYLIYYLKDGEGNVLLSIAPADHPNASRWGPSPAFQTRYVGRGGG